MSGYFLLSSTESCGAYWLLWILVEPLWWTQQFRVWIQRGHELINSSEWEFNQRQISGGRSQGAPLSGKGKRVNAACAVFELEVIVWVIVWLNVEGDPPPPSWGCWRWEGSPAGFLHLRKHGVTNNLMIIYCCLHQSQPNNICSPELVLGLVWWMVFWHCSHGDYTTYSLLVGHLRSSHHR